MRFPLSHKMPGCLFSFGSGGVVHDEPSVDRDEVDFPLRFLDTSSIHMSLVRWTGTFATGSTSAVVDDV